MPHHFIFVVQWNAGAKLTIIDRLIKISKQLCNCSNFQVTYFYSPIEICWHYLFQAFLNFSFCSFSIHLVLPFFCHKFFNCLEFFGTHNIPLIFKNYLSPSKEHLALILLRQSQKRKKSFKFLALLRRVWSPWSSSLHQWSEKLVPLVSWEFFAFSKSEEIEFANSIRWLHIDFMLLFVQVLEFIGGHVMKRGKLILPMVSSKWS